MFARLSALQGTDGSIIEFNSSIPVFCLHKYSRQWTKPLHDIKNTSKAPLECYTVKEPSCPLSPRAADVHPSPVSVILS